MAEFALKISDTEDGGLNVRTEFKGFPSSDLTTNSPAQTIAISVMQLLRDNGVSKKDNAHIERLFAELEAEHRLRLYRQGGETQ